MKIEIPTPAEGINDYIKKRMTYSQNFKLYPKDKQEAVMVKIIENIDCQFTDIQKDTNFQDSVTISRIWGDNISLILSFYPKTEKRIIDILNNNNQILNKDLSRELGSPFTYPKACKRFKEAVCKKNNIKSSGKRRKNSTTRVGQPLQKIAPKPTEPQTSHYIQHSTQRPGYHPYANLLSSSSSAPSREQTGGQYNEILAFELPKCNKKLPFKLSDCPSASIPQTRLNPGLPSSFTSRQPGYHPYANFLGSSLSVPSQASTSTSQAKSTENCVVSEQENLVLKKTLGLQPN